MQIRYFSFLLYLIACLSRVFPACVTVHDFAWNFRAFRIFHPFPWSHSIVWNSFTLRRTTHIRAPHTLTHTQPFRLDRMTCTADDLWWQIQRNKHSGTWSTAQEAHTLRMCLIFHFVHSIFFFFFHFLFCRKAYGTKFNHLPGCSLLFGRLDMTYDAGPGQDSEICDGKIPKVHTKRVKRNVSHCNGGTMPHILTQFHWFDSIFCMFCRRAKISCCALWRNS